MFGCGLCNCKVPNQVLQPYRCACDAQQVVRSSTVHSRQFCQHVCHAVVMLYHWGGT